MPKNHWIVSVLNDLDTYAKMNELPLLSDELTRAKLTAIAEMGAEVEGLHLLSQTINLPLKQH